uniref:PI4-kinase N-terminal domain-containing protein n=1 Tax=Timema poppense TaxID=170557 RepID=A0A7R9D0E0_TIMPO|nr:unnamed protein product [Timema poppensis]
MLPPKYLSLSPIKEFPTSWHISGTDCVYVRTLVIVCCSVQGKETRSTDSLHISTSQTAFEKLRDAAIENLCIALEAAYTVDPYCVRALVASVSNRLFTAEKSDRHEYNMTFTLKRTTEFSRFALLPLGKEFSEIKLLQGSPYNSCSPYKVSNSPYFPSETSLISTNIVIMLGHVAVALKDTPKTTDTILQFFQQRFCRIPSNLDILIVDQLGCMIISKCENKENAKGLYFL